MLEQIAKYLEEVSQHGVAHYFDQGIISDDWKAEFVTEYDRGIELKRVQNEDARGRPAA